jgi:hypothetical protein
MSEEGVMVWHVFNPQRGTYDSITRDCHAGKVKQWNSTTNELLHNAFSVHVYVWKQASNFSEPELTLDSLMAGYCNPEEELLVSDDEEMKLSDYC